MRALRSKVAKMEQVRRVESEAGRDDHRRMMHMLNGAIDYTTPIGNYTLFARLDGFYQSETRNAISLSPLFNVDLDGFAIFNAVATVSSDAWDLSFWVKNIGNEEGATGRYTEAYMGTDPAEGYFGNGSKDLISLPRTFGATLGFRF